MEIIHFKIQMNMGTWQTKKVKAQNPEALALKLRAWCNEPINPYLENSRDWEEHIWVKDGFIYISGNEVFIEADLGSIISDIWSEPFTIEEVTEAKGAIDFFEEALGL